MRRAGLALTVLVAACSRTRHAPPADADRAPATPIDARVADAAIARDAAPPAPAGASARALQVVLQGTAACARRADGHVRCWGDGAAVPVELPGLANAVAVALAPSGSIYVVTGDGRVLRAHGQDRLEDMPAPAEAIDVQVLGDTPFVLARTGDVAGPLASNPKLTDVTAIRTSGDRGLALHRDGHVTAFTASKATAVPGVKDIESLIGFGCGAQRGGAIACWDPRGKAVRWDGPANILERAAGDHFRCDLTRSGAACTGWNDVGQLGTGAGPDRATPQLVDLPAKPTAIAAGDRSACAVLDSGEVACWGGNEAGQLGDGTRRDRPAPIVVAGVTSAAPPAPTDGLREVQEAAEAMRWDDLPAACTRPKTFTAPGDRALADVVSAYAYPGRDGAALWLADFRLAPGGYRGRAVRGAQQAFELRLTGRGPIARGRYRETGSRRASLIVHRADGDAAAVGVDLVVERADAQWICGQLLAPRQPFATRVAKRAY